jgi:hypothetical protein
VSDDGQVAVRRAPAPQYSGARFTGRCAICSRAGLVPPSGELLIDVRAATQFVSTHSHDERD